MISYAEVLKLVVKLVVKRDADLECGEVYAGRLEMVNYVIRHAEVVVFGVGRLFHQH